MESADLNYLQILNYIWRNAVETFHLTHYEHHSV